MSSWNAWKERVVSLRDGWVGIWQQASGRPIIISVVALLGLSLAAVAYRDWPAPWDWLQGGHNGQIIINSPTVYTRQRLVNDRLQQATWLQEQLKATDDNFRSVDQLSRRSEDRNRRGGVDSNLSQNLQGGSDQNTREADQETKLNKEAKKPDQPSTDPILMQSTTAADFRAKNLFRDEVRAEITQTQLDDRHDINGNTIYRLAFDATVVAGTRENSVAGIRVALGHYPHGRKQPWINVLSYLPWLDTATSERRKALRKLYEDDYELLYQDWIRYMQKQSPDAIDRLSSAIISGSPEPNVRLSLMSISQFLLERVCQLKIELETPSSATVDCNPQKVAGDAPRYANATKNKNATLEFMSRDLDAYSVIAENVSRKLFFGHIISILSRDPTYYAPPQYNPNDPDSLDPDGKEIKLYKTARDSCRRAHQTAFYLSDLLPPALLANEYPQMGCPFYDSPAQRLLAGILLYEEMIRLKEKAKISDKAISDLSGEIAKQRKDKQRKMTGDPLLEGYINLQSAARCFAADYYKAGLNFFHEGKGLDRPGIEFFVRLDVVGRESDDCNLQVSELGGDQQHAALKELTYLLNVDTETFAYSITPKNFTENISTASETRDTLDFMVRYGLSGVKDTSTFYNDLRKRSNEVRAIVAHPLVVGFGSGRRELEVLYHPSGGSRSTPVIRETDFGWVIAPRWRDGNFEQIDNQYTLTAVISVPSWWRSVELDIETCWQSRDALSELQRRPSNDLNICEGQDKQTHQTVLRLPGAIAELSRKLGFEVLQEPYLSGNDRQVLEIGQKGFLLLKGARLWRSTEVTVGSQKADNIIVLPNMDGIIAEFKCVLPQLGEGGYDKKPIQLTANVWTSEGVATGAPVMLIWQDQEVTKSVSNPQAVVAGSVNGSSPNNQSNSESGGPLKRAPVDQPRTIWCPEYEKNVLGPKRRPN